VKEKALTKADKKLIGEALADGRIKVGGEGWYLVNSTLFEQGITSRKVTRYIQLTGWTPPDTIDKPSKRRKGEHGSTKDLQGAAGRNTKA